MGGKVRNKPILYFMQEVPCKECGVIIPQRRFGQGSVAKFCSKRCAGIFSAKERGVYSEFSGKIPKSTVGAIQELKVSTDLLSKGFQVFRALSPSCDCDLVVLSGKKLVRLEVTTGYINKNKSLIFPKHSEHRYDALAVVAGGDIHYVPEPSVWFGASVGDETGKVTVCNVTA